MFTIKFIIEGGDPVVISANAGEKLLDVARKANVAIDAPCSGNGVCGKCRVRLASGYLDAPINRHITSEEYAAGWRLACLAQVSGDAEIEVPDIASAYRNRMKVADLSSPEEVAIFDDLRRQLMEAGFAFSSDLSFLPVELTEPTLADTMPDNERLLRAVEGFSGGLPQELAEALVSEAIARRKDGHDDDVTVMVLELKALERPREEELDEAG